MTHDLCYMLLIVISTHIKFNHTNSAIHSLGQSSSFFTSTSDYASAQWRLVLHIFVTCSPHVNKCWVMHAIYGIHWGWSHWPITIQHVQTRWRSFVSWRTCLTGGGRRPCECPEALGIFLMDFCIFWSLTKMRDLVMCNIIKMMQYNGYSQMLLF